MSYKGHRHEHQCCNMPSDALSLQVFAQRAEASLLDMILYHQSPGQHPSMYRQRQAPVTLRIVTHISHTS